MSESDLSTKSKFNKVLSISTVIIAAWYVFLCLLHYFYQRPLWNDEAMILLGIKSLTAKGMFTEILPGIQVFPRAYLFIIQQVSSFFNYSTLSLRLFSFASMLSGFLIWSVIAEREFKEKLHYFVFILSWCASAVLLYYSSELKQYAMDLFLGSVFILFAFNQEKLESKWGDKRFFLTYMTLPLLGVFSYVVFFFLIFPFYNLMLSIKKDKKRIKYLIVYLIAILIAGFFIYNVDMQFRHGDEVTNGFGDYFISYETVGEFFRTYGDCTISLFRRFYVQRPIVIKHISMYFGIMGLIYMFYAFFRYFKRNEYVNSLNVVALVLYVQFFIAGSLKVYPFGVPRTSLFFCPIVIFLNIRAIIETKKINVYLYKVLLFLYIAFIVVLSVFLSKITMNGDLHFQPTLW